MGTRMKINCDSGKRKIFPFTVTHCKGQQRGKVNGKRREVKTDREDAVKILGGGGNETGAVKHQRESVFVS